MVQNRIRSELDVWCSYPASEHCQNALAMVSVGTIVRSGLVSRPGVWCSEGVGCYLSLRAGVGCLK